MFRKIVSRLSLSPSAVSELTFYARRLKQERVTRTFSAIAAVLVVGLQFAAIAAPPTPSNAAGSPSDILTGGIVSQQDLLQRYDASTEIQGIFSRFGISRADLVKTTHGWISSTDHALQSLSRVDHGNGTAININGTTYWYRPLYYADHGIASGSKYEVYEGTRTSDHGYFAVMKLCGNIVIKTVPPAPTPRPKPTPKPTPLPVGIACIGLTGSPKKGDYPLKVNFAATGSIVNEKIVGYLYDFGDGTTLTSLTPTASHIYTSSSDFLATVRVKGSTGTITPESIPCSFRILTTTPPVSLVKTKSALNVTQNVDATRKPANGGDVIRYTLTTKNTGKTEQDYLVIEHLEDVLEYATVTDTNGGTLANDTITWPRATIKPGASLVKSFTVTVKNPVPPTPVSVSDKYSYDLRMDNVYGNFVSVQIAPPLPKQIEQAASNLPATGPAASTTIILLIAGLGLYFYLRNRQLIAEVKLLRHDFQGGQ